MAEQELTPTCSKNGCVLEATCHLVAIRDRRTGSEGDLCDQHAQGYLESYFRVVREKGLSIPIGNKAGSFDLDLLVIANQYPQSAMFIREIGGKRLIVLPCNLFQAQALHAALKEEEAPRPQMHDVALEIIQSLGGTLQEVIIDRFVEDGNVYHCKLSIAHGKELIHIDLRPTDGVNLAVRSNVPILVVPEVLSKGCMRGSN